MTTKEIEKKQTKEMMKFELAKKIREMLDEAKKTYGKEDWEGDDMETEICTLVFEE
jgi:hypothetical protein